MLKYLFYILLLATSFATTLSAQSANDPTVIRRAIIIDGDTIPNIILQEVRSYARHRFKTKRQEIRYTRLVRNVKKALPYARMCAKEIELINEGLAIIQTEEGRKEYLKTKEKELFAKFEQPLRHLTISQGKILIKLIDRETGNTSYELIKSLKGRFAAFLWQGVARLFGSNLKSEYDSAATDAEIENIVLLIDEGLI